jgi:hypothetical protein
MTCAFCIAFLREKKAERRYNKHCTIRSLYTGKGITALIVVFSPEKIMAAGLAIQEKTSA